MRSASRSLLRWALPAVLVAAVTWAPTGSAGAATPEPPDGGPATQEAIQTFRNEFHGECLDDTSVAFRLYDCNGTNPQKWRVRTLWPDTRELRNVNTGRCVEAGRPGRGTIRTWTCDESGYQKWYVDHANDGTIRFRNRATGDCIHAEAVTARLQMRGCTGEEQQWWL